MSDKIIGEGEYQSMYVDPPGPHQARAFEVAPDEWRTKDGRVLKVVKMGDVHLMNTILFLRRLFLKVKEIESAELAIAGDFIVRGEAAQDAIDEEMNRLDDTGLDEFIKTRVASFPLMLQEVARRNLYVPELSEEDKTKALNMSLAVISRWLGARKVRKEP